MKRKKNPFKLILLQLVIVPSIFVFYILDLTTYFEILLGLSFVLNGFAGYILAKQGVADKQQQEKVREIFRNYRVLKLLVRKQVHTIANKLQIVAGHTAIARKHVSEQEKVVSALEKIRFSAQEIAEELQIVRKNYLADDEHRFDPVDPVQLVDSVNNYFRKQIEGKKLQIEMARTELEHKAKIESSGFNQLVMAPLMHEVLRIAQEGSKIRIDFEIQPNHIVMKINFCSQETSDFSKIEDQLKSKNRNSGPFSDALDVMEYMSSRVEFIHNSQSGQAAFHLFLPAA